MSKKAKPAAKASAADVKQPDAEGVAPSEDGAAKGNGRRKLILMALPAVLVVSGAGLWLSGLLGKSATKQEAKVEALAAPVYIDLPEMVANLDSDPRRPRYVKLRARVEVRGAEDERAVRAAMPR